MTENLIIKNFGPLKSINIDLGKVNVIIGNQATGKSTIAKILSVCRYFSYIVNFTSNTQEEFQENSQFYSGLKDWGLQNYLKKNSQIIYNCELYEFELKNNYKGKVRNLPCTKIKSNSDKFTKLLGQLNDLKLDEIENKSDLFEVADWYPNENFFRLNVKKVMNNPLFIPAERGFQSLSVNRNSLVPNAILDELTKLNKIVKGYNTDIEIKPLNLLFRNEDGLSKIKNINEEKFHFLHNGASGFQSTIPIFLAVKFNNDLNINRGRTIIIEEPELNLFPKTQKRLIEFFVETTNKHKNQFIFPTHSPYILSTLENLMYAYKLGNQLNGKHKKEVSSVLDEKLWLNPDDVHVYYLKDGYAEDAMLRSEALIDKNKIDSVSETINQKFDSLLNIEIKMENELQKC